MALFEIRVQLQQFWKQILFLEISKPTLVEQDKYICYRYKRIYLLDINYNTRSRKIREEQEILTSLSKR